MLALSNEKVDPYGWRFDIFRKIWYLREVSGYILEEGLQWYLLLFRS